MHVSSGDVQELTSLAAFSAAVAEGRGYVVVTDRSVPTRFHKAHCQALKPEYFETKVVKNGRKRGQYFLAKTYEAAAAQFAGKACNTCRPDLDQPPAPPSLPTEMGLRP